MQVLNKRLLHRTKLVDFPNNHRNVCQFCSLGCAPAALACNQLILAGREFPHKQWLQHADLFDRLGQITQ